MILYVYARRVVKDSHVGLIQVFTSLDPDPAWHPIVVEGVGPGDMGLRRVDPVLKLDGNYAKLRSFR